MRLYKANTADGMYLVIARSIADAAGEVRHLTGGDADCIEGVADATECDRIWRVPNDAKVIDLTPKSAMDWLCAKLDISPDDVRSSSRHGAVVRVRRRVAWILHQYLGNYSEVARLVSRDHSTVMNQVAKYDSCPEDFAILEQMRA